MDSELAAEELWKCGVCDLSNDYDTTWMNTGVRCCRACFRFKSECEVFFDPETRKWSSVAAPSSSLIDEIAKTLGNPSEMINSDDSSSSLSDFFKDSDDDEGNQREDAEDGESLTVGVNEETGAVIWRFPLNALADQKSALRYLCRMVQYFEQESETVVTDDMETTSMMMSKKMREHIMHLKNDRQMNVFHCVAVTSGDTLVLDVFVSVLLELMDFSHLKLMMDSSEIIIIKKDMNNDNNSMIVNEMLIARDMDGYTPLSYAVSGWNDEMCEWICKHVDSSSLLKCLVDFRTEDSLIMVGGNIPVFTCGGRTPLHLCAENGAFECFKAIFDGFQQSQAQKKITLQMSDDNNITNDESKDDGSNSGLVSSSSLLLSEKQLFEIVEEFEAICLIKDDNDLNLIDLATLENNLDIVEFVNHHCLLEPMKPREDLIGLSDSERIAKRTSEQSKIRQRLRDRRQAENDAIQQTISQKYHPLYPGLFYRSEANAVYDQLLLSSKLSAMKVFENDMGFPFESLDDRFLNLMKTQVWNMNEQQWNNESSLMMIIEEWIPGVFVFPMFKEEYCRKLVEECEHFESESISSSLSSSSSSLLLDGSDEGRTAALPQVQRPNSMNNYGLALKSAGMINDVMGVMMKCIGEPLANALMIDHQKEKKEEKDSIKCVKRKEPWIFTDHHSFTIRYEMGKDEHLSTHVDSSDVTLNVCIQRSDDIEGGQLYFHPQTKKSSDKKKTSNDDPKNRTLDTMSSSEESSESSSNTFQMSHRLGFAVMHVGNYLHGSTQLIRGKRTNLVSWFRQ